MARIGMKPHLLVLGFAALTLGACDKGGKEGDFCYSSTAKSTDCKEPLVCAKCAEGNICVRHDGQTRYGELKVAGRTCSELSDVAGMSDQQRGVP